MIRFNILTKAIAKKIEIEKTVARFVINNNQKGAWLADGSIPQGYDSYANNPEKLKLETRKGGKF